ncbi:MAG: molybdopterin-binding protein [Microbacterium sp.]|uniref:TOBE domain-containing protein n=1 Tax=Microbacterium sp. TaxID=51671 RepID=UPI003A84D2EC
MQTYKIADAARLLGVSDDTVRRWVDQGVLPVTGTSPAQIDGAALAVHAVELARAPEGVGDLASSARNRFVGLVTRIQVDGVMAQVDIQAGPHRVVSLMSAEAVRELALEPGSLAVAVVKATTVIIETPKGAAE